MKGSQRPLSAQEQASLLRNVRSLYIVSALLTQLGDSTTQMMSFVLPSKRDEKALRRNMKEFIELKKQMVSMMKKDKNTLTRNEQGEGVSQAVLCEAKNNVQEVADTNKPAEVISRLRFVPPSMTLTENLTLCMLIGKLMPYLAEKLTTSQLKSLKGRLTSQKFKAMMYLKNEEKPHELICSARRRSSTAYEKIAGIQEQLAM